ncbi:MAG: outer membrane protein assembly factor BamA [Spirochaetales bacterium]|nr:outer membrane protein assembly factor BamA [Spirochaetales bacterium]
MALIRDMSSVPGKAGLSIRRKAGGSCCMAFGNNAVKIVSILMALFFTVSPLMAEEMEEEWYLEKTIIDIKFVGLDHVNINDLKPIVGEFVGKNFTKDIFYEIDQKLYELEYFNDIQLVEVPGDEDKTTVILEYHVEEKPIVADIRLTGHKAVTRNEILDNVQTKRGDFENRVMVREDEIAIKSFYIEKGFTEAAVSSRIEKDDEKNVIIVYFDIDEGFKTTIKEILFSGNDFVTDNTLRGELVSKKQDFFHNGVFKENNLADDKIKILDYYNKKGYIDAEVERVEKTVEQNEEKSRSYLILTFYIKEGEQFLFGDVTFEGNNIFPTEDLKKLIKQKPGKVFNKVQWEMDVQAIRSFYADSGYIHNSVSERPEKDDTNKIISYTISIIEKDRAHIENILIVGNDKTKDYVIERELPFEVGDIFSAEKIRQGIFNLYNLQYFSNIQPQPMPGSNEGLMDLIINVEEMSWADFKMGLAFSGTEFPISGQFGWSDRNFLGLGVEVGIDLEASPIKQGLALRYQDNYLFGKGWGGGLKFSLYHSLIQNAFQDIAPPLFTDKDIPDPFTSEEEYTDAIREGIDTNELSLMEYDSLDIELGANTSIYFRTLLGKFGISTSFTTNASYVWYDSKKYRHYNKTVRENLEQWNFINTWGNTLSWDTRDIFYNPESGFYLAQSFIFSGFWGKRNYTKTISKAEAFVTLFDIPVSEDFDFKTVLALHASASFMLDPWFGLMDNYEATEREKLWIDGMNVARGWPFRRNGEALLDFSLELRHPLVKQLLWWTWFFDAASMWDNRDEADFSILDNYLFSFGAGLRVIMPGLPIRLYFCQRFRFEDDRVIWEQGEIPLFDPLSLRFVVAITQPGFF